MRDKHGIEIKPFDVIKIFHFIGARRKKHYMYKWVKEVNGRLMGFHLTSDENENFTIDERNLVQDHVEIVQRTKDGDYINR